MSFTRLQPRVDGSPAGWSGLFASLDLDPIHRAAAGISALGFGRRGSDTYGVSEKLFSNLAFMVPSPGGGCGDDCGAGAGGGGGVSGGGRASWVVTKWRQHGCGGSRIWIP